MEGADSLVSTVIGTLTERIRLEELSPGDRLPSEGDIAKEMGVSRTVVREAFQSLAALRLIELNTGKRATVAALDFSSMAPLIDHGISTDQITIQQIYDVRRTIEIRTAALAALRRSDEQADLICRHAAMMTEQARDPDKLMEHDLCFHQEIARASKNPVFSIIIGAFEGATRQTWPIGWRSRATSREQGFMLDVHRLIAEAIRAGDPQSAQTHMATHFDESVRALLNAGIL
ncbi:FadR family transcriptional regulator [Falsochrobactrum sp. TDYN1]|uniref:FadR family transcriptional regulator n=1 Tax=Falsochrobactrum tianjinense TaxID=2706015 RepID=A0A949UU34_9HYPH|nr:FadR/GntR family transcriptional regulator [Falsochrobactrum sp. TDYN1]MBV2143382.1 FadR family transcriptional regulator [Falsochrobactrum sp. TDYN1]